MSMLSTRPKSSGHVNPRSGPGEAVVTTAVVSSSSTPLPASSIDQAAAPMETIPDLMAADLWRSYPAPIQDEHELPSHAPAVERARSAARMKLTDILDELPRCDVGPGLMPRYLALLKPLAHALDAAKSAEQVEAVDLQLRLVHTAWDRSKRNERKRQTALKVSAFVFAIVIGALIFSNLIFVLWTGQVVEFSAYMIPGINVPLYVVIWSAIGSCSAVLYRVNRATDLEMEDPVRLMIAQPIIGIVMGTVSYLIIQLGVLTLTSNTAAGGAAAILPTTDAAASERAVYFLSFMAFLVGFSDRFANTLLRTLAGRYGGDKDADLVTIPVKETSGDYALLQATAENVERREQVRQRTMSGPVTGTREAAPAHDREERPVKAADRATEPAAAESHDEQADTVQSDAAATSSAPDSKHEEMSTDRSARNSDAGALAGGREARHRAARH